MDEQEKAGTGAAWIGMLLFALGFAGFGIWGLVTGQVAWGLGSLMFGLVWGFVALRARRKAKSEG